MVCCAWMSADLPLLDERVPRAQRISTIEQQHPDQWVVVEVTRLGAAHQPLTGRVLACSSEEDEITGATLRIRRERPDALLYTFYTGELIMPGTTLILAAF
jgi:hypothetical protein